MEPQVQVLLPSLPLAQARAALLLVVAAFQVLHPCPLVKELLFLYFQLLCVALRATRVMGVRLLLMMTVRMLLALCQAAERRLQDH
jgi:hypothetical protein